MFVIFVVWFLTPSERVQTVSLTSFSCNWIILHYEIDQMKVKIQLNPTGVALCYTNLSKNYVLRKTLLRQKIYPCSLPFICHLCDWRTWGWASLVSVVIFDGFCSNWSKLMSAQPANSQTFNQKKYCYYLDQDFWNKYFFVLWNDDVYGAEGHTEVDIGS